MPIILETQDVIKQYKQSEHTVTAVNRVSLKVEDGEFIAIIGSSGSGKTTLLNLIAGELDLLKRDSDEDIFIAKAGNPEIGYLKQIAFEDPTITVDEEIRKVFHSFHKMQNRMDELLVRINESAGERDIKEYTTLQEEFESIGGYYYEKEYDYLRKIKVITKDKISFKRTVDCFDDSIDDVFNTAKWSIKVDDVNYLDLDDKVKNDHEYWNKTHSTKYSSKLLKLGTLLSGIAALYALIRSFKLDMTHINNIAYVLVAVFGAALVGITSSLVIANLEKELESKKEE